MTVQTEAEAFWYLPENLNSVQKAALVQLRSHLSMHGALMTGYDDDPTLLRFLKARQWNVEPTVAMYKNMAQWRKDHKVEDLYHTFTFPELPQLLDHYPHFYHKTDKYGRPVYIELLGRVDCCKILEAVPLERVMDYHIWHWERLERQLMPACTALAGRPIFTCTVIIDMAGLSMKSFNLTTKRLMTAIFKIDQNYYPEHLATMFIINTPMIFSAIWAVVSPMLEERTRKKIIVLGCRYVDNLTQLIPLENLPKMFGGLSECAGPKVSEGPWFSQAPCTCSSWLPEGQPAKQAAADAKLKQLEPPLAAMHSLRVSSTASSLATSAGLAAASSISSGLSSICRTFSGASPAAPDGTSPDSPIAAVYIDSVSDATAAKGVLGTQGAGNTSS